MHRQVYPERLASGEVLARLERDFPQVLVIEHPIRRVVQVYEVPKGSDWTAYRLWNAIVTETNAVASEGWPKTFWWNWRGAPRLVDELASPHVGGWLIAWLQEKDLWRLGGIRKFFRDFEEREAARKARTARQRVQYFEDIARDLPLGKRSWAMPKVT
jgi:hypothetical protein